MKKRTDLSRGFLGFASNLLIDFLIIYATVLIVFNALYGYFVSSTAFVEYLVIIPVTFVPMAAVSLFGTGKKGEIIAGGVITVIILTFFGVIKVWPHQGFFAAVSAYWNGLMSRVTQMGYLALPKISVATETADTYGSFFLALFVAVIFSTVFTHFRRGKGSFYIRILLPLTLIVPLLVFSLPKSYLPFMIYCAGLFGEEVKTKTEKHTEADGSRYGALIAIIVLVIGLTPLAKSTEPAPSNSITPIVEEIRMKISDAINGENVPPVIENGRALGEQEVTMTRSAVPSRRVRNGRTVMTVTASVDKTLYLSSWYGAGYSDGAWTAVKTDVVPSQEFWRDLQSANIDGIGRNDFVTEIVSIQPVSGFGRVLSIPYNFKSFSVRPDNIFRATDSTLFSDRIVKERYTMNADVPTGTRLSDEMLSELRGSEFVRGYKRAVEAARNAYSMGAYVRAVDYIDLTVQSNDLTMQSLYENDSAIVSAAKEIMLKYLEDYTSTEVAEMIYDAKTIAEDMRIFGYNKPDEYFNDQFGHLTGEWRMCSNGWFISNEYLGYSTVEDSNNGEYYYVNQRILQYDNVFTDSRKKPELAFDVADAVATYLTENCRYSLDPKSENKANPMEEFLNGSREGYCVQFATAGALIMRCLGIPTRYVEGYRVSDFTKRGDVYFSDVSDYQAHAWIEIWVDGFGWYPYEMTRAISAEPTTETTAVTATEMAETSETSETSVKETEKQEETTAEASETAEKPTQSDNVDLTFVIICLTIAVIAAVYVVLFLKSRKRIAFVLKKARDATAVMRILKAEFSVCGLTPKNELPSEFAEKVWQKTGMPSNEVLDFITKEKYGNGADIADIRNAAAFATWLLKELPGASLPKKIFYRYILMRI